MQALPPALEGEGKVGVILHLPLPSQPCSLYLRQMEPRLPGSPTTMSHSEPLPA